MTTSLPLHYVGRDSSNPNGEARPLLVLLHGFASYEQHLFRHAGLFDPQWPIIAPRAPLRIGPGAYRWFYFTRTATGPIIETEEQHVSLRLLVVFLEAIRDQRKPRQIFLLGHSQGGSMALSVLMTRPDLIDGVVNVNGRIVPNNAASPSADSRLRGFPVFTRHGEDNPIVPLPMAHRTRDLLMQHGVSIDYRDVPNIGHGFTPEILADSSQWLKVRAETRTAQPVNDAPLR